MSQRQEMERKIYERAKKEGREQEYIEQRVTESTQKLQEHQQATEHKRLLLKTGRQNMEKNRVPLYVGVIGQYAITAGSVLRTAKETGQPYYRVAYSVCSPRDRYSLRVTHGYIGHRLFVDDDPYAFSIYTGGGAVKPYRLMRLIEVHIQMDLLAPRVPGPLKLIRQMTKTQPYFRMVQIREEKDYEKAKPSEVRERQRRDKGQVPYWNVLLALRAESADVHEKLRLAGRKIPDSPVPFAKLP